MDNSIFFNAHHSPVGAFSSLTFGYKGAKGGPGIELTGPANENFYIGVESSEAPNEYFALPFFETPEIDHSNDYDIEGLSDTQYKSAVFPFHDEEIARNFGMGIDEWKAGDLTFRVFSPLKPIPDPQLGDSLELKFAIVPSVVAEITINNRNGKHPRKAFFGYAGTERSSNMRISKFEGTTGVGQGRNVLFSTDDPTAYAGVGFQPESILNPKSEGNRNFLIGNVGLVVCTVQPGEVKTIKVSVSFFREDVVTTGIECRYLYRRFFSKIEDVAKYSLQNFNRTTFLASELDKMTSDQLCADRYFMFAHSIRSYLGATQCMETLDSNPLWIVNEGEYRMMNTFDLTVDQVFLELALNPWTVKNVLELFVSRYSYVDEVKLPGSNELHPGGLVFTHDMGVGNSFSDQGYSCYEQAGLKGVFSYMSAEELINWTLCAASYVIYTQDLEWLNSHKDIFKDVLHSLVNRDHPVESERNGVVGLDSSRCGTGAEITTYDSLDTSLGQARNNSYLALKTWSSYILLSEMFRMLGSNDSETLSLHQAFLCSNTLVSSANSQGILPAIINEKSEAHIIPAIEGLVYLKTAGLSAHLDINGPSGELIEVLRTHFRVLMESGANHFRDGGWRLSSTSRNSWLSKIYLCQYVSEAILGFSEDSKADHAHVGWLKREDNSYFAWSDQMLDGKACGSRYYPRGVTSALWLAGTKNDPISEISNYFHGTKVKPGN